MFKTAINHFSILTISLLFSLLLQSSYVNSSQLNEIHEQQRTDLFITLHTLRVSSFDILNDYYAFVSSGNGEYELIDVKSRINEFDSNNSLLLNILNESGIPYSEYEGLKNDSENFKNKVALLLKYSVEDGYTDMRVLQETVELSSALSKSVSVFLNKFRVSNTSQINLIRDCFELDLLLTKMQGIYLSRANFSDNQFTSSAVGDEDNDLERMTANLNQRMLELEASIKELNINEEELVILEKIQTKWFFIENLYMNYKEKSAPFIVHNQSSKISLLLSKFISLIYEKHS